MVNCWDPLRAKDTKPIKFGDNSKDWEISSEALIETIDLSKNVQRLGRKSVGLSDPKCHASIFYGRRYSLVYIEIYSCFYKTEVELTNRSEQIDTFRPSPTTIGISWSQLTEITLDKVFVPLG